MKKIFFTALFLICVLSVFSQEINVDTGAAGFDFKLLPSHTARTFILTGSGIFCGNDYRNLVDQAGLGTFMILENGEIKQSGFYTDNLPVTLEKYKPGDNTGNFSASVTHPAEIENCYYAVDFCIMLTKIVPDL